MPSPHKTYARAIIESANAADEWGGAALQVVTQIVAKKSMRSMLVFVSAGINILLSIFLAGLDRPGVGAIGAGCMAFGIFLIVFLWPALEDETKEEG